MAGVIGVGSGPDVRLALQEISDMLMLPEALSVR